jgi:hypothetical protein
MMSAGFGKRSPTRAYRALTIALGIRNNKEREEEGDEDSDQSVRGADIELPETPTPRSGV